LTKGETKMSKILGISGTQRINGNSELLLKHSLIPFEEKGFETKHIKLSEVTVNPCKGCEACSNNGGVCVIDDDMKNIYEAFRWCDGIIISSPVYSRNICSQLLAVLDRHYALKDERPLEGKLGGAIAVGRGAGQAITINAIYNWMLSSGVICVPGELNGVTATASEPNDVLKQKQTLNQARILGENILNLINKLG
jgi:multimeric flavodoxin WrbA